jgi:glycosyltransferase involved in cell wall biosynthesis
MKDMRIALLTSEFLPNWGGVGTYCVELAKMLSNMIDLHVITVGREEKGELLYSEEKIRRLFGGKIDVHFLTICPVNDTFLYNAKMQFSTYRKLPRLVKEQDFDLVHTNFPHMPDLLLKIRGQLPFPSVTTLHTTITGQKEGILSSKNGFLQMDFSEKSTLLLYGGLRVAEELYLRKSENFVTVSNWMKSQIRQKWPFMANTRVIHNGVDTERFPPKVREGFLSEIPDPIVLFSSRLTVAKGLDTLIHAIPKVLKENKAHFVLTGAGQTRPWINLLDKLKIPRSCYTFLGYVDYQLLPSLYAKSDVFVAPSLYENLPIRILEAMACECPVVASNICAVPEAIEDGENGILVNPNDADGLSKAISTLLEDKDYRTKLGRNARRTVLENFSLKTLTKEVVATYEEVCA